MCVRMRVCTCVCVGTRTITNSSLIPKSPNQLQLLKWKSGNEDHHNTSLRIMLSVNDWTISMTNLIKADIVKE